MKTRSLIAAGLFLAGSALATPALAQTVPDDQDGFVRLGVTRIKLADDGVIATNGVVDPTADYETNPVETPQATLGYFIHDNFALEASVTGHGTTINLPAGSLAGTPNLGDDEFIVLMGGASFHPLRGQTISPYVGGGIAWQITTQERDGLGVGLNVSNSHGPYVQAGIDVNLTERFGVYFEGRKAWYTARATGQLPLDATFTAFADVDAQAQIDPFTLSVGGVVRFGGAASSSESLGEMLEDRMFVRAGVSLLSLADDVDLLVGGAPFIDAVGRTSELRTDEHFTASVQVGYFVTDNLAITATVGLPPKIDINGGGALGPLPTLGSVTYGPTALTLQYNLTRSGWFRPYAGAGLSYMIMFDEDDGAFQQLNVEDDLAPVVEIGSDFMFSDTLGLFLDVKKAWLRTTATGVFPIPGGPTADVVGAVKLDPWVISTGVSFHF